MSQAEQLLNSLSTDEVAAYAARSTVEPHIIIGADRFITVPTSLRRIAVEHDHNVETVTFECPRYWDEHDLSKMAIYINYILSNGYADSYPVSNVTVEDDLMLFTWTIKREVTQVAGGIKFIVCAKKTDDQGNEANHWNSELCEDMYVSKGMETVPQVASEYPDLITELLLRMSRVEEINVQAGEMQELLNETQAAADKAEQVKNEALDASDYIKNNYANAVKGNVSGSVIRVDDVSPIEHDVKCWIHGKNLVNVSDVSINNFTGYHSPIPLGFEVEVGKTYTLSLDVESTVEPFIISVGFGTEALYKVDAVYSRNLYNGVTSVTFTPTEDQIVDGKFIHIRAPRYATETLFSATISNIQLEKGSVATEYEPYIDPLTVTVTTCGKNIISINAVTVKAPSTHSAFTSRLIDQKLLPPGVYTASCKFTQKGSDKPKIQLAIRDYDDYTIQFGSASSNNVTGDLVTTFTIPEDKRGYQIFLYSNMSETALSTECLFENIQVEVGNAATDFEPYNGDTYTPGVDSVVLVRSNAPCTTMFTDTPGVTIDAEYNRDSNSIMNIEIIDTDEPFIGETYPPRTMYSANTINKMMSVINETLEKLMS